MVELLALSGAKGMARPTVLCGLCPTAAWSWPLGRPGTRLRAVDGQAALPLKPVPGGSSSLEGEWDLQELWTFTPHPPNAHRAWAPCPEAWKGSAPHHLELALPFERKRPFQRSRASRLSGAPLLGLLQTLCDCVLSRATRLQAALS